MHAYYVSYLLSCFLFRSKSCMSLLPQELSCPQEGLGVFELPSLEGKRGKKGEKDFMVFCSSISFNKAGHYNDLEERSVE